MSSSTFSPDLGTFSVLPRELRDKIYSLALDLNIDQISEGSPWDEASVSEPIEYANRTGVLRASKRIHQEAKVAFFQTNEFCSQVDHECLKTRENRSIMGEPGFTLKVGHTDMSVGKDAFFSKIPYDMIPHMQNINFTVGTFKGLKEGDIVGVKNQGVSGPERPSYVPLMAIIHNVCGLLKSCHQLHLLRLSIRSIETLPGSIEVVIDPIRKLRRIKWTQTVVWSMQDSRWVDWSLRRSYGRYIDRVLSLPDGIEAPKYVGDEKEPNMSEDNIFDIMGATWLGGSSFHYPGDSDDEYDDDYDDNEDFFDDYYDYYNNMVGGFGDEDPSTDSDVDWDLD